MKIVVFHLLINLVLAVQEAFGAVPVRITISGYVRESVNQRGLAGVNIYGSAPGGTKTLIGTTSQATGYYSITLPRQSAMLLTYSLVGYQPIIRSVPLQTSVVDITLNPGLLLSEVRVKAGNNTVAGELPLSRIELPVSQLQKIPTLLGEQDVLRVLQLMPGVQKGSEGQTGLYVRGGGPDQNLMLLDGAVVYNPSHLFGFLSVFNGDALQSVALTKGGFPARYGGRLSSVLELNTKDGRHDGLHGEAGISLISSRLMLEGPLGRPHREGRRFTSFLLSARRTYLDALLGPLLNAGADGKTQGGYYFGDVNAKLNYELSTADKFSLSGYIGRDQFSKHNITDGSAVALGWGNATGTFRWNHRVSPKLFTTASLLLSEYQLRIDSDRQSDLTPGDTYALRYYSGIRDLSAHYDVDYFPSTRHDLRLGFQHTFHRFTPNALVQKNGTDPAADSPGQVINAVESGIYLEDTWRPSEQWRLNGGLRMSYYQQATTRYLRPEPRLSLSYAVTPDLALQVSYARMNQYVHLLSNTGIGLPTDLWVPTTQQVQPQASEQLALGLVKNGLNRQYTLTVEGYYKTMSNLLTYKEGSSFIPTDIPAGHLPANWSDNVTAGRGWSYGLEWLLQKKRGRFTGWAGYTLSWTRWQFGDVNSGQPFFPRYDRRHDISLVGLYDLTKRITLSGTWVYGTGNALTMPTGRYSVYQPGGAYPYDSKGNLSAGAFQGGQVVQDYGTQKNGFRAEAYHRLDLAMQLHRKRRSYERTWAFSVYNAYNRRNLFYYQLEAISQGTDKPKQMTLVRYSIFPVIPSFSYSLKF